MADVEVNNKITYPSAKKSLIGLFVFMSLLTILYMSMFSAPPPEWSPEIRYKIVEILITHGVGQKSDYAGEGPWFYKNPWFSSGGSWGSILFPRVTYDIYFFQADKLPAGVTDSTITYLTELHSQQSRNTQFRVMLFNETKDMYWDTVKQKGKGSVKPVYEFKIG